MIGEELLIAIIAALLNILFSILIPPLLNKSKLPFVVEIKNHYECNKNFIIVSSILTIVLVYISLKITPVFNSQIFGNISKLNNIRELPTQNISRSSMDIIPDTIGQYKYE